MGTYRLGVDVGGTFTDFVLVDDTSGEVLTEKTLTTPDDPWEGIHSGLCALASRGTDLRLIGSIVHGTTLVINALIERKGASVGLLTTRGFRDVLHFGRELRYDIYDPAMVFPEPIVPRSLRREVRERIGGDGSILEKLDVEDVKRVVDDLLIAGAEAFAVCFLHSYLYPDHELAARAAIAELAPHIPISLSHEVLPQIGEYERCCTTSINAYVQPLVQRYLRNLMSGLKNLDCRAELYLMTSSGGTMTSETAMAFPIHLVESGPAAGASIAAQLGMDSSLNHIIAFDMGGTTAKACLVRDGNPLINKSYEVARVRRHQKGSGLPVAIPVIDLLEIGAGGGSIAEVNEMGLLTVGPRSAGADPGPACYGRGGTEATVTDANVILGFIRPESFLGGAMALNKRAAEQAVKDHVAQPLEIEVEEAAIAIHQIVTENMSEAARVHSVEMNVDVRGMGMVAFGGAGPIHAYGVAERLGLSLVLCPRQAGVLSAGGLLNAPLAFEFARSLACDLQDVDVERTNALLRDLTLEAESLLARASSDAPRLAFSVDMCYSGQRYEVTTPLSNSVLTLESVDELKHAFDAAYERAYGRRLETLPARCVTWRVIAKGTPPKSLALQHWSAATAREESEEHLGSRPVIFPGHGVVDCTVYPGASLEHHSSILGPAIVEEVATTMVIPPGAKADVDRWGNVLVRF